MPTPLVHSAVAAASARWAEPEKFSWRALAVLLVAANWADLDVIPATFSPDFGAWHHGPTHSVLAAVVAGFALAAIPWSKRGTYARRLPWTLLASGSHIALDLMTIERWDLNYLNERGLLLLWPFSDLRRKAYVAVFQGAISTLSWTDSVKPASIRELGFEAAVAALLVGAAFAAVRVRRPSAQGVDAIADVVGEG